MNTSLVQLINAAFADRPPEQLPVMPKRGRRKLWQLPHSWHCPIVGTCLTVAELRKQARRVGIGHGEMSDYTLHTAVVGGCDERTDIDEAIQRHLDKRHAAVIARYAQAKDGAAVLKLWKQALDSGNDIAGALWAAWTNANLDDDEGKVIYGDIHMLSHQVDAAVRGDLAKTTALEQDNATVRDRSEALAQRVERLEERNAQNAHRAESLAAELNETQDALAAAEAALELFLGIDGCNGVAGTSGCGSTCPAEAQLAGRFVH